LVCFVQYQVQVFAGRHTVTKVVGVFVRFRAPLPVWYSGGGLLPGGRPAPAGASS
jgi:hypothetical protein